MPLEEAGLRLVAEGGDEFDSTMGSANNAFESFGEVAESVGGGMDAVSDIMTGALMRIGEIAVEALAAGGAALVSFFGDAFSGALEAETTMARFDAQLLSVARSSEQQAAAYSEASQQNITYTRLTADELENLQDTYSVAAEKLGNMEAAFVELEEPTAAQTVALKEQREKVEELGAEISGGMIPITTTLANQMGLLPPVAHLTRDEMLALADEYKNLAGGSDDAVIAAEAVLLKFTAIGADAFPLAIEQSANLAALMGTDLASASQLLGLALDDPTSSLTRLDKATGAFTEAEKEQIKAMAESGDVAGAQALILENLESAIGGTAEMLAMTTEGQWAIFTETIADAGETIMGAFLPAINGILSTFTPLIPIVEQVAANLGTFFETILAGGDVGASFDALAGAMYRAFGPEVGLLVMNIGDAFTGIYDFVIANWPLLQETFNTVFTAISGVMTVVSDFITVTLLPAIGAIMGTTTTQLPTAQQTFESVMAGIVVATQLVSDFITNILVPAFTYVVDWTVANWPMIQATIEAVMNAVSAVITAVVTYVTAFWEANGAAIVSNSTTTWSTIQTTITTIITTVQAVITTVLTAIQTFWAAHGESIVFIVSTMMANAQASIATTIAIIQAVIEFTLSAIQAFWDTWGVTIMAIVSNMTETIGAVIEAFAALLRGDWETLGTSLETIWTNLWDNVGMTMDIAATSIGTIISDMVTSIGAAIVTFASDLIADWTELGASLISGWMDAWVNIGYIVGTGVQSILNIDWGSVGTSIITSIATGISNAAGALASAAAQAAYDAYQAMLAALGMGSPSILFIAAGENTQESMAMGIQRAQAVPEQAMIRASEALVMPVLSIAPQLSGGARMGGGSVAAPPSASFSPSVSPSAGPSGSPVTISVDARGASPSEVARAVTKALRDAGQYSDVRLRMRGAM